MTLRMLTRVSDRTHLSRTVPSQPESLPSSNHRSQPCRWIQPPPGLHQDLRMSELGCPYCLEKYSPPVNVLPLQLCRPHCLWG